MPSKSDPLLLYSAIILTIAFLFRDALRRNWCFKELNEKSYSVKAPYNRRDIPTTYYSRANLTSLIPKWYNSPDGSTYIHLFRLAPDEKPFEFDKVRVTADTLAKARNDCEIKDSILCSPCFPFFGQEEISTEDILYNPEGHSKHYAAFAQLSNLKNVHELWDVLNLTTIDIAKMDFEHAFMSNFKEGMVTANLHGNPVTSSVAVQFYGTKSWLFFPPWVYLDPKGLDAHLTDSFRTASRSPEVPYDVFTYKSQPGDILFFAQDWGHTVYTHPGPNFMMNFRHLEPLNVLYDPVSWLHAVIGSIMNKPRLQKVRGKPVYMPYSQYNLRTFKKVDATCASNFGGNSGWDEEMTDLLMKTANGAF